MKSLALRTLAFMALGVLAHQIKPFTGANLFVFVSTSVRSITEWVPTSTLNKVSVVAAVVTRAWQSDNGAVTQPVNLLASLSKNAPAVIERVSKPHTLRRVRVPSELSGQSQLALEAESEEVAPATDPFISWQHEAAEEAPTTEIAPLLPALSAIEASKITLEAPALMPLPKREACEMPAAVEPSAVPATELIPETKPFRSNRFGNSLGPETQLIVLRRSSRTPTVWLLYLEPTRKNASNC